jgi:hypothetical protein
MYFIVKIDVFNTEFSTELPIKISFQCTKNQQFLCQDFFIPYDLK